MLLSKIDMWDENFIKNRILITNIIYYLGFFYIFLSIWFIYLFFKLNSKWKFLILFFGILFLILAYGQFIERFWIKKSYYKINKNWDTRIVLISDLHLGVYKNSNFLKKVINKINQIKNVDFILIAGDLTFWPKNIETEFQELKNLKYPAYAVVGNHDVVQSGKISFKEKLKEILKKNNVIIFDNKDMITKNNIHIFGLGSHFAKEDNTEILKKAQPEKEKTILLFHNPDTSLKKYPKNIDFSNTVSFVGHTHCGQVRIPCLYKKVVPVAGDFYESGIYDLKEKGKLIISCGLGESGVPIRLFNRPEIAIIDL